MLVLYDDAMVHANENSHMAGATGDNWQDTRWYWVAAVPVLHGVVVVANVSVLQGIEVVAVGSCLTLLTRQRPNPTLLVLVRDPLNAALHFDEAGVLGVELEDFSSDLVASCFHELVVLPKLLTQAFYLVLEFSVLDDRVVLFNRRDELWRQCGR